ncbi:MAG: hypothetical protein ABH831_02715 [Candidatus Nealsonbacteria bacterium]
MKDTDKEGPKTIFNLGTWTSLLLAVLVVLAISFFLSWQYNRIVKDSEEKLTSLEDILKDSLVQGVMDKFLTARINSNETQAKVYFTEGAMEQLQNNEFELIDNFESYRILKKDRLEDESFKFTVILYGKDKIEEITEIIIMVEILDNYYIDSINVAG